MSVARPFEIGLFTFGEITANPATGRPIDPATRLREFMDLATVYPCTSPSSANPNGSPRSPTSTASPTASPSTSPHRGCTPPTAPSSEASLAQR